LILVQYFCEHSFTGDNSGKTNSLYAACARRKKIDRLDFKDFILVYLVNDESDFELELTINKGRSEPYDLGDGYGHLAVSVTDLDREHARLQGEGLQPRKLVEFAPNGEKIARFFFITDPDGYEIEVLERGGRFK
jgi:lactoylglutathione lyase